MSKAAIVLALLVLPAMAFGASATVALQWADGTSGTRTLPASGKIDVVVCITAYDALNGISSFGGYLTSSADDVFIQAAPEITRVNGFPFKSNDSLAAYPFDTGLASKLNPVSDKDFGFSATTGTGHGPDGFNYVAPADGALPWKIETITITVSPNPAQTLPFVIDIGVTDLYGGTTVPDGLGGWNVVNLDQVINSGGVTIEIPEPATLLLVMAGALPFLRRRSA